MLYLEKTKDLLTLKGSASLSCHIHNMLITSHNALTQTLVGQNHFYNRNYPF